MNAPIKVSSLADAEQALAVEEGALADARLAGATADAALTEARNRLAESPTDHFADAVERARADASRAAELVQARERRCADAEGRVAEARRTADRVELARAEGEAKEVLSKLPTLFASLVEINRTAAAVVDQIEDLAEEHGEIHDRARTLAARLGTGNPIRCMPLPAIRTAAGLALADAIGVPEHEALDLRGEAGLTRALRQLEAARLNAAELGPAVDRLLVEADAAIGTTTGRWLEPLRDVPWAALEETRRRQDQAEALLAELQGGTDG